MSAHEEFLPVVIEDGRESGRRERVNICSTREQASDEAARLAARARRTNPTARGAVLRRRVGPWERWTIISRG
jgi:hypothetical protein